MAAKTPDLTIPIALDLAKTLADLRKLKDELKDVGAQGQAAGKKTQSALFDVGSALTDLAKHQGWQMAKDLGMGMVQAFDEAAKRIREMGGEFVKLQQLQTQIAALQGRANNDDFTVEQADLAVQAKLKPEEWVKFQEQFQSYGGAYIEGPDAKLSEDDAQLYQQYVAEFAKARGLAPAEAAQLAGGLLQFQDGKSTAADMLDKFGKVFKTLERAPTPVAQLLPMMTRTMSQGATAEDAARMIAIQSEGNPGEEEVYTAQTLKALRDMRLAGRGGELGLEKGQTPIQMAEAAARILAAREDAGGDLEAILKDMGFQDRERKGMLAFVNRGVRDNSFARTKGYQDGTASDWVSTELDAWEQSDGGRRAGAEATEQWLRIRNGSEGAAAMDALQQAKNELLAERRFERPEKGDALRGLGSMLFGSRDEQLIRERALQNTVAKAQAAGVEVGGLSPAERNGYALSDARALQVMSGLLERIADNTAKAAAPKPLNAAPPTPRTRP